MTLKSKERNFLRKLAHNLDPVVRIGKNGFNEEVYKSIREVINTHELIKIKVLNNSDIEITRDLTDKLENETKSYVISTIGFQIIMFKPKYVNNKPSKFTKLFNEFREKEL